MICEVWNTVCLPNVLVRFIPVTMLLFPDVCIKYSFQDTNGRRRILRYEIDDDYLVFSGETCWRGGIFVYRGEKIVVS